MKIVSFTEANKDFKSVLDTMNDADIVCIKRQNSDDAVVMSLNYYNSLIETLYLLKSPENSAHLAKSIAQYRAGEVKLSSIL
ncbi:type II toxin-antitoxin system Phd/YefM family antitoxin [Psychrobacter sp. F1192]|uniref:Antitoxin n=1 Tax=Psychrobacter coccoides TaxID=2818440 RepID=A0ABS3NRN8_9GAMM|nr:type II toxin-antitoxin system Phd/YefM family antitoxin [Psychrobacter coccoides]MBO1531703.1 type II toxin-antitoxin system Phd/YefM family antitoxin [Psychrobacter coccoides]